MADPRITYLGKINTLIFIGLLLSVKIDLGLYPTPRIDGFK